MVVRQKVKIYFLPGQLAKKGKQSSPFFEVKATKNPTAVLVLRWAQGYAFVFNQHKVTRIIEFSKGIKS
jgi:hypothetical protein